MKTRFPIGLNLAVGLSVIFFPPAGLPPSSFQPVYAQVSAEKKETGLLSSVVFTYRKDISEKQ